jgi:uncharacterized protein YraI
LPMMVAAALLVTGWNSSSVEARTLCVGKEAVFLRGGPSSRHNPVGSLPAGACGIQVVGKCVSGWCDVSLGTRRGWVDARQVTVQEGGAAPAPAPAPKQISPPASPRPRAEPPPQRQAAPPPPAPPRPAPPAATGAAPDRDNHCVMGVRPGDTLRIRSGPGVENREVGAIPPDACGVLVGAPCSGSWCPVTYRGIRGWSNASFLRPPWMR